MLQFIPHIAVGCAAVQFLDQHLAFVRIRLCVDDLQHFVATLKLHFLQTVS